MRSSRPRHLSHPQATTACDAGTHTASFIVSFYTEERDVSHSESSATATLPVTPTPKQVVAYRYCSLNATRCRRADMAGEELIPSTFHEPLAPLQERRSVALSLSMSESGVYQLKSSAIQLSAPPLLVQQSFNQVKRISPGNYREGAAVTTASSASSQQPLRYMQHLLGS